MKILIFGSTGSVGKQCIEVIKKLNYQVCGISFLNNYELAQKQINDLGIKYFFTPKLKEYSNVINYDELIKKAKPDLVVNAISGYQGLEISVLVIQNKINLALANKESLVMAGKFIKELANQNNVKILPIDSEHSSLYELLINQKQENIKQLIITCSGGAFYNKTNNELQHISFEEAIKHPNWNMGYKISIDSATLINKCFEIVEAYWLFNNSNIIAIYHPESIVHSMVEFKDHSIFANLSKPDMHIAIQSALNNFNQDKQTSTIDQLNFHNLNLHFDYLDQNKWIPIKWAYEIINDNKNNLGIIINVSNDIAIEMFKNNNLKFNQIIDFIQANINKFNYYKVSSIDDVFKLINLIKQTN